MITTKTTVSFRVPEEYKLAEKFSAQHQDWIESCTSHWIGYTKQETYSLDVSEEGEQE